MWAVSAGQIMLELIDVTKTYESAGDSAGVSVLNGITLKVEKG